MILRYPFHSWNVLAFLRNKRASRGKAATQRMIEGVGKLSWNGVKLNIPFLSLGKGGQKSAGIGVSRFTKEPLDR